MIIVYGWMPIKGELGHVAMQIGKSTYISFYPSEDDFYQKKQRSISQKIAYKLSTESISYGANDSYQEDCKEIGRGADEKVHLYNLSESSITEYWNSLETSYNLISQNCSTILAEALAAGLEKVEIKRKPFQQYPLAFQENPMGFYKNCISIIKSMFIGEKFFWTPATVVEYAKQIKLMTEWT